MKLKLTLAVIGITIGLFFLYYSGEKPFDGKRCKYPLFPEERWNGIRCVK